MESFYANKTKLINNRVHRSSPATIYLALMRFEHNTVMVIFIKLVTVGFSPYWISLGYCCCPALDIYHLCDSESLEGTS